MAWYPNGRGSRLKPCSVRVRISGTLHSENAVTGKKQSTHDSRRDGIWLSIPTEEEAVLETVQCQFESDGGYNKYMAELADAASRQCTVLHV